MRRTAVSVVVIGFLLASGCGSDGSSSESSTSSSQVTTTSEPPTTTSETTVPPTTTTTEAPAPVASTTADGRPVPEAVLATAEQIYRAAQAQDLTTLGTLASAPDFTYVFGDPPGDPVVFWSADPAAATGDMMRVLEQSVATDGSYWWWPGEFLTDETYFGYRIGIDNGGTWRFAVAGD